MTCLFKFDLTVNRAGQIEQPYGRSPVWVHVCWVRPRACREPDRAQLALVRLHAIVRLHMCGVITHQGKRGAALLTLTDPLPSVDTSVLTQGRDWCERLPTDVTRVRSLAGVNTVVLLQTASVRKSLAADVTAVWPFPRVCPTMAYHVACNICRVLSPLALVPRVSRSPLPLVPANEAVMTLHVSIPTTLHHTCAVGIDTVNRASTWGTKEWYMASSIWYWYTGHSTTNWQMKATFSHPIIFTFDENSSIGLSCAQKTMTTVHPYGKRFRRIWKRSSCIPVFKGL